MSLITCPECGKQFSEFAKCCPNCGIPTEKIVEETVPSTSLNRQEQQHVHNLDSISKVKSFMLQEGRWWKLIIVVVLLIVVNAFLMDSSLTISFGGLLLIALTLSCGIGYVLSDKIGACLGIGGVLVLMMFHKLLPTVDFIESDNSHEVRYACLFVARDAHDDFAILTPTKDYLCNRTGKELYITTIGYGDYKYEDNTYQTIAPYVFVEGKVTDYFIDEAHNSIYVKGYTTGERRNYLHYHKL